MFLSRWRWVQALILVQVMGCGQPDSPRRSAAPANPTPTLDILCSFFPIYLFTQNVVGKRPNVRVLLLLPPEMGCPHDYDLRPEDRKKIADAELFILNGAGLEEFAGKLQAANRKMVIVDTSSKVDTMEGSCDHDHEKEKASGAEDHRHAINPHFFASPAQAAKQVEVIVEALVKADSAGAEVYRKNGAAFQARLRELQQAFKASAKQFRNKNIVTIHGVFDYLAHDLGLSVVANVSSRPGHDPAAKEMRELIATIKEQRAVAIFTEPQYSARTAEVLAKTTGIPLYRLDPVANGPANAPLDYYESTMRHNLKTLTTALTGRPGS